MSVKSFFMKIFTLFLLFSSIFQIISCSSIRRVKTRQELEENVKKFNDWYNNSLGTSKSKNPFFLKVVENNEIGVFTNKDLTADEELYTFEKSLCISAESIYTLPYEKLIRELETKYGYDELTYLVIILIHEYYNPQSKYREYLDILPTNPPSPIFNYWENSKWIDPELMHSSVLRKLVDFKIQIERRSRGLVNGLFSQHSNLFNSEHFNEDNVEWALFIIDTRVKFVGDR